MSTRNSAFGEKRSGTGPRQSDISLPAVLQRYITEEFRDLDIPCVHYTFSERCGRFVLILLSFPISLMRQRLVKEGEIGMIWEGDRPKFLAPGRYVLLSPTTRFVAKAKIDTPCIIHGPVKIIQVNTGFLGYCVDVASGCPLLLKPGRHVIKAGSIRFERFLDLNKEVQDLAGLKLVCIKTGNVGVVYHQGQLEIYNSGLHVIEPPRTFERIVSTQQQIMMLKEDIYDTCDYVPLKIVADVFYQITDPDHVCREIRDLDTYIRDTAIATLASIIRNSTLADIGQSSTPAYKPQKQGDDEAGHSKQPPPYSFYSRVHDTFIQELQKHAIHDLGINILNIRIESMEIANDELARNIALQAVRYAQVQSALANMESERQVQNTLARQEAEKMQIHANAEAAKIEKLATAEANATLTRASAEKEALILQGQGRKQYAELISATDVGKQLAVLQEQVKACQNVQKVIYLPADSEHLSAVWALGGGLNKNIIGGAGAK